MTLLEVLWMSWLGLAAITGAIFGYEALLASEEQGHFVLPVGFAHPIHHRMTRMQLERRAESLRPLLESCEVLTAFATILVIGYYVDWAIRAVFV
jgi:hypothetical protein